MARRQVAQEQIATSTQGKQIALLAPSMRVGGVEQVTANLAIGLDRAGHRVDLLLGQRKGKLLGRIPDTIDVMGMADRVKGVSAVPFSPPRVAQYLRRTNSDAVIAGPTNCNISLLVAAAMAQYDGKTILTQHIHPGNPTRMDRIAFLTARRLYPSADAVVCVSDSMAEEFANILDLPREDVRTVYNPVVSHELQVQMQEPVEHEWFDSDVPVVASLGRLADQKDFPTLLRSFATVLDDMNAHLFMMGSGERRDDLESLAERLDIAEKVEFTGFIDNPYKYLSHADLFVLSSIREGLPTVLIEALACGCPVVATDCPSGPREILQDGAYGSLVPVCDDDAMATAIRNQLQDPPSRDRQQRRSEKFSIKTATDNYLEIVNEV